MKTTKAMSPSPLIKMDSLIEFISKVCLLLEITTLKITNIIKPPLLIIQNACINNVSHK